MRTPAFLTNLNQYNKNQIYYTTNVQPLNEV